MTISILFPSPLYRADPGILKGGRAICHEKSVCQAEEGANFVSLILFSVFYIIWIKKYGIFSYFLFIYFCFSSSFFFFKFWKGGIRTPCRLGSAYALYH